MAATPRAWQIAFSAADNRRVSGLGNMLLGMSAHVNRDLPMVLAEIGLVKPDGTSRKPDHDKVHAILNLVIEPLLAAAGARFDPSIDALAFNGTPPHDGAVLQLLLLLHTTLLRNAAATVKR